ncbi:DUF4405 domain-containing protein [Marinimicrobium sp. ABcell2]|uniref:DUF4405 domain-containing protein n=1 Tax=Marinimicrobium sp. ABcell2 TaxID=3069751 RepID=UPI0027B3912B|nr:DUF4405 domain-containing protein [Marinimicrobium sp. ABcell2]MDQ2075909.1 DUF4405 domain-containing protein [Marinimicrobium sp. ABcell2]
MKTTKFFSVRTFTSLSLFLAILVMAVTSILLFVNRHTTTVALMHTVLGLLFLVMAFWHLKNNFAVLRQYLKVKTRAGAINGALLLALLVAPIVTIAAYFHAPPLLSFYEWGNTLRAGDRAEVQQRFQYVRVNRKQADAPGLGLTIDVRTGPYYRWPQYAIWLETLDGNLIEPIYVTGKLASNRFDIRVVPKDASAVLTSDPFESGEQSPEQIFSFINEPETRDQRLRPESLPVFLHAMGAAQRSAIDSLELDGYTGATLLDSFLLSANAQAQLGEPFKVRFEINQSFDFNDYWSSNRFPDDPVYSGDGYSAQPSLIYEAIIDPRSAARYYPMSVVGRGHHSGRDGHVHPDISTMTTALELVDRIIVEVDYP